MEKVEKEMDQVDEMFCKFCLQNIIENSFRAIGEVVWKALAFLSLNVRLDERENYMCNDCSEKLFAALDFKMMCLDTEDSLLPYIDSDKGWQVDLRDVYSKVKGIDNVTVTSNQQVCRLCMHIVDKEFLPLEKFNDMSIMEKYIPEVDFSITKDPVVCKQCWNSLNINIDFLRKWMDIEKKIKIESKDSNDYPYIKSEEINLDPDDCLFMVKSGEIDPEFAEYNENRELSVQDSKDNILKCEPIPETCLVTQEVGPDSENHAVSNNNCDSNYVAHQLQSEQPKGCRYNCDKCNFVTKHRYRLRLHLLRHEDPSVLPTFGCDKCNYETRSKYSLIRHQLVHKESSELQMYKCDECDFQSKWRSSFQKHQKAHLVAKIPECKDESGVEYKNSPKVHMYKCSECNYETLYRYRLKMHQLIHAEPSELQMYKCNECEFQSKRKDRLRNHKLIHRDPSELQMYKCDKCDFQTKRRNSLKCHQMVHKDISEIKMYKCDKCDFETKMKHSLKRHQITHESPSEGQIYKCKECDFKSKWKNVLRKHVIESSAEQKTYKCEKCNFETRWRCGVKRHQLEHERPSHLRIYKCSECDFETASKPSLKNHQIVHKDPSEIPMYKCDKCNFETKYKYDLKGHQVRHEGSSKVYKCKECSFQTTRSKDLVRHRLIHCSP